MKNINYLRKANQTKSNSKSNSNSRDKFKSKDKSKSESNSSGSNSRTKYIMENNKKANVNLSIATLHITPKKDGSGINYSATCYKEHLSSYQVQSVNPGGKTPLYGKVHEGIPFRGTISGEINGADLNGHTYMHVNGKKVQAPFIIYGNK